MFLVATMGLLKIHGDHGGLPKVFGDHWGTTKCSLWPPQSRWKFMARPLRLCQKFIAAMTMLPEVHGSHCGSTGSSRRPPRCTKSSWWPTRGCQKFLATIAGLPDVLGNYFLGSVLCLIFLEVFCEKCFVF